ncbi:MAG: hypothetical protein H0U77_07765 [Nocardioidaceae bacterium]|nr:hypothetical protein [Nocardioidaceae bacterium]
MSTGIHPALQIRLDEARRHAEIPPITAPHAVAYVRLSWLGRPLRWSRRRSR